METKDVRSNCQKNIDQLKPLSLAIELVNKLNASEIKYCHWKNNFDLEQAFSGNDDLDLLIERKGYEEFLSIVYGLGFKLAANRQMQIPSVFHLYGMDQESNEILHLHVYTRLITGESHLKNYHLNIESIVLKQCSKSLYDIPIPSADVEMLVYLIRYFIKISCLPGLILHLLHKSEFDDEYNSILSRMKNDEAILSTELLDDKLVEEMFLTYKNNKSLVNKILFGLRIRRKIRYLNRYSVISQFLFRYWQIIYRLINKLVLKQRKRLSSNNGSIVTICGLDATGKTTVTSSVYKWLNKQFDVKLIHVGKPPPVILTFPIRLALLIYRKNKYGKNEKKAVLIKSDSERNDSVGYVYAARYLALAYERYSLLRKAKKWRERGFVVLCDRYVSSGLGQMDSPRIDASNSHSKVIQLIADIEKLLYSYVPQPDLLINLTVPIEVAIQRNNSREKQDKETDNELIERYRVNSSMNYKAENQYEINTETNINDVLASVKTLIWTNV